MRNNIPRIVIAAVSSGSGKTTIVAGLLAALRKMGVKVQSYKVGPDYIDPGYHYLASGKPAHNLDSWLVPKDKLKDIFLETAQDADIAIIEGVMGLYDGGRNGISSTAEIAKQLKAPVVLVIDAKSMGDSAAAIALGFRQYDPEIHLAGVILNRLGSETHKSMIVEAMGRLNIPVFGAVRRNDELKMPERHLGLLPTTENDAAAVVDKIAEAIGSQVNLAAIQQTAAAAEALTGGLYESLPKKFSGLKIGIAQDEAFSFYYPESLAVLKSLGAELIPFSPLNDKKLPEIDGLIFGGGFPEMFAGELSSNSSILEAIRQAAARKMPIYAECGGLMYLTEAIYDFNNSKYAMAGLIPAVCRMNKKLQTVGYVQATAKQDNLFCRAGELLKGHEFHFSTMEAVENANSFPWAFQFEKMRTRQSYPAGYAKDNLLASYLHLHFAGNIKAAEAFLTACNNYYVQRKEVKNNG